MDNCEQKQRSLIMCTSPLHMLIAEKIISINSNETFDLILLVAKKNDKFNYYYSRLNPQCQISLYFSLDSRGASSFLDFILQLKKFNFENNYNNLYLANIDSRHFQYIISKNEKASIFTFDDGIGNITSYRLKNYDEHPIKIKWLIWRIIGIRYDMKSIMEKSKLHYTIYDNVPNIFENTSFISLWGFKEKEFLTFEKTIKIFLGQPLNEVHVKFDREYILSCLNYLKITNYFPHPRESFNFENDLNIIHSSLIFEDFITEFIKENPYTKIEIYSFISSAILNIASIKQLSLYFIADDVLYNLHKEFYDLARDYFNIKTLCVE